jgi:CDP-diacylglycerol--serine O-phosphatidyltransferase
MMSLTRHIPNALTCGNLLCGCIGIVGLIEQWPVPTAYFVWAAVLFDFLDGFAARALKANSPIGKELDSLADMVSFGVLPAVLMFFLMKDLTDVTWLPLTAFALTIFSALRLAKFNIDERQHYGFIGLPTPANALLVTGLPFLQGGVFGVEWTITSLVIVTAVLSWLMVSPLHLLALKFKHLRWKENQLRFTLVALSVLLLAILGPAGIVMAIIMYVLLSLVGRWWGSGTVTSK